MNSIHLTTYHFVGAWVSFATAVCGLVFIATYTAMARWWRSPEGRLLMAFAGTITFLTGYAWWATLVMPGSIPALLIRVGLVGVIGLLMLIQTVMMIRSQAQRKRKDPYA